MGVYRIYEQITIPSTLEEVWDFVSRPENLKEITPPHMGFHIMTPALPEVMYPGMMITYKVSPLLRIGMTWVTEITHVETMRYFVDEQRSGPYALWHHEHHLEPHPDGTLMTDIVTYKLPFGFIGRWGHRLFVKKQLNDIFEFRKKALEHRFGAL
jgi:ligand-binding SRPBCC domain-containing protein